MPARALRRWPVTLVVVAPYLLLYVPEAIYFRNPGLTFMVGVLGIAILATAFIELLPIWRPQPSRLSRSLELLASYGPGLGRLGIATTLAGSTADLTRALLGAGTITAQVGAAGSGSAVASLLSIVAAWPVVGLGLLFAGYLGGHCRRRTVLLVVLASLVLQLVRTALTAITAPLVSYLVVVLILMLYTGIVSARQCAVVALVAISLWPALYGYRNDVRLANGVAVSRSVDAFDRLRYDEQITRAENIPPGTDLGQPSMPEILRYGLVPRMIDPDRPPLSTGISISVYLGGRNTSAYSFLPVTTVYVLEGFAGPFLLYGLSAMFMGMALRGGSALTPARLVFLALMVAGPLGWFVSYPASLIGMLQGIVSAVPLLVLGRALRHSAAGQSLPSRDEPANAFGPAT